jgi:hypothetical protein
VRRDLRVFAAKTIAAAMLVLLTYDVAAVHGLASGRFHWTTAHIVVVAIILALAVPPKRRG